MLEAFFVISLYVLIFIAALLLIHGAVSLVMWFIGLGGK